VLKRQERTIARHDARRNTSARICTRVCRSAKEDGALAWETGQRGGRYCTRTYRQGSQRFREYIGGGERDERAAAAGARARAERERERA
jgi:hypothetical protein